MWVEGVTPRLEGITPRRAFLYDVGSIPCRVPGLSCVKKMYAKLKRGTVAVEWRVGLPFSEHLMCCGLSLTCPAPRSNWICTVSWASAGVAVWGGCRTLGLQLVALFGEAIKVWVGGTGALGLTYSKCFASWFSAKWVLLYKLLLLGPPCPSQCDGNKPSETVSKTNLFLQKTCEEGSSPRVQKCGWDRLLFV